MEYDALAIAEIIAKLVKAGGPSIPEALEQQAHKAFDELISPRCTDFQPLASWVRGLAPTAEAGIRYKKFLTFRYTYNEFGTEDQHSRLDFRWEF